MARFCTDGCSLDSVLCSVSYLTMDCTAGELDFPHYIVFPPPKALKLNLLRN